MKMMKRLLLGTAASVLAIASARRWSRKRQGPDQDRRRREDLQPLWRGFYQIPGEGDICIRVGATARLDAGFNADSNGGPFIGSGADSRNNRVDTRDFLFQGRGTVWF